MPAPTPVTWTEWNGRRGLAYWFAAWTDGTNFTDTVVIDVSALSPSPAAVKIRSIHGKLNGNITANLEFDATTDEAIYQLDGQTDVSIVEDVDFTVGPNLGRSPDKTATGFTGDVVMTSTGVANGDEATLLIEFDLA